MYANNISPLSHASCNTFNGYKYGRPPVVGLFRLCCPATVIRSIAFRIVDSVNGMLCRWTFSDRLDKRVKRVHPFGSNSDTATAIFGIRRIANVVAAILHTDPNPIFRTPAQAVSGSAFFLQAATRFNRPPAQSSSFNNASPAAQTRASPKGCAILTLSNYVVCSQIPKSLARKV